MKATLLAVAALMIAAGSSSAQGGKAPAKAPATKAPATKAPATKTTSTKGGDTKGTVSQAAGSKAPPTPPRGTKTQGAQSLNVAQETAPESQLPDILREAYDYDDGGRRDPFFSLLATSELRPTIADLKLVGILFDESGRRPVAVLRDRATNEQYRITIGMTLGRMRVQTINRRSVIFSIEEFGLNRQDSLVLGDTTRARAR